MSRIPGEMTAILFLLFACNALYGSFGEGMCVLLLQQPSYFFKRQGLIRPVLYSLRRVCKLMTTYDSPYTNTCTLKELGFSLEQGQCYVN